MLMDLYKPALSIHVVRTLQKPPYSPGFHTKSGIVCSCTGAFGTVSLQGQGRHSNALPMAELWDRAPRCRMTPISTHQQATLPKGSFASQSCRCEPELQHPVFL